MESYLDDNWKQWIATNLKQGRNVNDLYIILITRGFNPDSVKKILNYYPRTSTLTDKWSTWITLSLEQGIHKDDIHDILVKNRFESYYVKRLLDYELDNYLPNSVKVDNSYVVDNFFSYGECMCMDSINLNPRICDYIGVDKDMCTIVDSSYLKRYNEMVWTYIILLDDIINQGKLIIFEGIPDINYECKFVMKSFVTNKLSLHKFIPNYTKLGFEVKRVPEELFEQIIDYYEKHKVDEKIEVSEAINTYLYSVDPTTMIELDENTRDIITNGLILMLEEWADHSLIPQYVYGIRNYHHGANLKMHVDRYRTHIFGVIINIDQKVNTPWPLYIYDHYCRLHKIFLQPGDMLFYESSKLAHGRPELLDGSSYLNIFMHAVPADWDNNISKLGILIENGIANEKLSFPVDL